MKSIIERIEEVLGKDEVNEVLTPADQKRLDKAAKILEKKVSDILHSTLLYDIEDYAKEMYHDDLLKSVKRVKEELNAIGTILNR
jgi:hypothetical protein